MYTVGDIITEALEMTGIKSGFMNLDSDDGRMGLKRINGIIAKWNIEKLLSSHVLNTQFTLNPTQSIYTIGSGGDIVSLVPQEIIDAYTIDTDSVIFPINIVQFNDWNNIIQKSVDSDYPSVIWYNPSYPLGSINVYPTPSKAITMNLTVRANSGEYTSTSDQIILPPEFREYLIYQLAVELCSFYGEEIPQYVYSEYKNICSRIKSIKANLWQEETYTFTPATRSAGIQHGRTFISPGI